MLIVVHPGSLLNYEEDRIEEIYGNYEEYLSRVEDAINKEKSIIIALPTQKNFLKKRLPFQVPKDTMIIKDKIETLFFGAEKSLISILDKLKIYNVEVCGEQLWWYSKPKELKELYLGCVVRYYNILYRNDISSKIRRELCYPLKNPQNFRGEI